MTRLAESQIVILSSIEWDAAWQRHQIFASQWAEAGHEVFFIENTGFRNPSPRDLPRLWNKVWRLFSGGSRRRGARLPANLHVVNPLVLPPTWRIFRRLNSFLLVPGLVENLHSLGLGPSPVVVCYLPTDTTLQALKYLSPALTVYDCVDNFHGLPDPPKDLAKKEKELIAESALVLATSRTLYDDKSRLHPRVKELHHGVAPAFFLPERRRSGYTRLCYFGTIWRALDYEPIRALADAGFQVDLIGPRKEAPPPLPEGVRLKSAVPHAKLPETLSHYDALLLPYADDEYNRGVIPAKLYECLATGLAVLASPLPALRHMGDCLYLVKTPAEWVEAANGLPETETPERRAGRVRKAREHAQAKAFSELKGAMEASLAQARHEPGSASPTPNQHLMAFLRGFTWIGFLYGLAKASTLLTQVAAGRWLGPIEYGKANLVLAAAAYLQILPMMGFPLAMSKFVSEEKKPAERSKIISTTFTTFLLWGSLWLLAAAAGRESIAGILSLPIPLFNLSLAFAYFTAFYIVVSSPLLGLKRFDYRGAAEAIYGLSAPAFLIFYALKGPPNHEALIITLCSSLAVAALYSLWTLRTYLKPAFEPSAFRLIFRYALVATLNLLAIACVLGPARLILHHHHHSAQEVGIFSAYFTSTAQVSLAFLYMLSSVLVPLASSAEGQRATWRTFRKFFLPMALGAMGFFLAAEAAALSLFGRQYPFRLDWAALFAAAAALILIHGVAAALYSARDFRGLCISVAGSLVAGLSNAALGLLLIPRWGITGAVLALVGAYGLGLAAYALASSLQKK